MAALVMAANAFSPVRVFSYRRARVLHLDGRQRAVFETPLVPTTLWGWLQQSRHGRRLRVPGSGDPPRLAPSIEPLVCARELFVSVSLLWWYTPASRGQAPPPRHGPQCACCARHVLACVSDNSAASMAAKICLAGALDPENAPLVPPRICTMGDRWAGLPLQVQPIKPHGQVHRRRACPSAWSRSATSSQVK